MVRTSIDASLNAELQRSLVATRSAIVIYNQPQAPHNLRLSTGRFWGATRVGAPAIRPYYDPTTPRRAQAPCPANWDWHRTPNFMEPSMTAGNLALPLGLRAEPVCQHFSEVRGILVQEGPLRVHKLSAIADLIPLRLYQLADLSILFLVGAQGFEPWTR